MQTWSLPETIRPRSPIWGPSTRTTKTDSTSPPRRHLQRSVAGSGWDSSSWRWQSCLSRLRFTSVRKSPEKSPGSRAKSLWLISFMCATRRHRGRCPTRPSSTHQSSKGASAASCLSARSTSRSCTSPRRMSPAEECRPPHRARHMSSSSISRTSLPRARADRRKCTTILQRSRFPRGRSP